jgi:fatty acyl-CoA reductase
VKTVFLLVRGKKGVSAVQRVEKLLCGPLFHLLHKQAAEGRGNVFGKVQVVEGDMDLPGLGLSPADTQRLMESVTSIMHCAADLTLDAHIQQALRSNYCSCRELLALAGRMQRLRAFAFCSTYWVRVLLS